MLCPGCGNEIEAGEECPICATGRARRRAARRDDEMRLCPGCGNTIYGAGACTICESDHAPRRRHHQQQERTTLCVQCGNEMVEGEECPVCASGRGGKQKHRYRPGDLVLCTACNVPLTQQDWDGVNVMSCPSCQGMLFPPNALESVLNKLRETADPLDYAEVLKEFRDRYKTRRTTTNVRYKLCPICREAMVRRNYAGASGIVIDACGDHGHWVDQNSFAELSEWISKGGDQLVRRRSH